MDAFSTWVEELIKAKNQNGKYLIINMTLLFVWIICGLLMPNLVLFFSLLGLAQLLLARNNRNKLRLIINDLEYVKKVVGLDKK